MILAKNYLSFRDAVFTVLNPNPLDGVSVSPVAGVIPGRACCTLYLEFNITSVQAFEISLWVKVQFKSLVELKFVGFVYFPKVYININYSGIL